MITYLHMRKKILRQLRHLQYLLNTFDYVFVKLQLTGLVMFRYDLIISMFGIWVRLNLSVHHNNIMSVLFCSSFRYCLI